MAKHAPPNGSAERSGVEKDADTGLKTNNVPNAISMQKTTQQDRNRSVNESTALSQDITYETSNSQRRRYFSEVLLELLIPFLTDQDISRLYNASPLIAETMKPLYSSTVFPHSDAVFHFMKAMQSFPYPLRLPPASLTSWQFHEIISNPDKCCRCSQPISCAAIGLHGSYTRRFDSSTAWFDFCEPCSMIDWRNASTKELFRPIPVAQAKRLIQGINIPGPLEIRINRKLIGVSSPDETNLSSGRLAYFQFGILWILHDNPRLATKVLENKKSAASCAPEDSPLVSVAEAKASLMSVLSLTELPTWIDNYFLTDKLRKQEFDVRKDADFIQKAFDISSSLYTWMQTSLVGLHKQTEEFIDTRSLLDAAMSSNLQNVKERFVAKAHHCSDILYALAQWQEPPTKKLMLALEDRLPQAIPDLIFRSLFDLKTRAKWLQKHAEELDMPLELLKNFSETACVEMMSQNLCLADAKWRWNGLSELLNEKEQSFAMKHYETQRWIFYANLPSQSREEVARMLNIRMTLQMEFPELSEQENVQFDTWEKAQEALENARTTQSLNEKKSALLDKVTPEVRAFMNKCGKHSGGWSELRYINYYNKASTIALAESLIEAACKGYDQLKSFLQDVPESESAIAQHLVQQHLECTERSFEGTVDDFLKKLRQYLKEDEYSESSSPHMLQAIVKDVYCEEYQRFCEHNEIKRICKYLEPHLKSLEDLLHNQSDSAKSRIRRAAYNLLKQKRDLYAEVNVEHRSFLDMTFLDTMQEVLKLAKWEDQSAILPVWLSPKLLELFLQKLSTDPDQATNDLVKEERAWAESQTTCNTSSVIDPRFNLVRPSDVRSWFQAQERIRECFLNKVRRERRWWESDEPSARKGLPENCIKRIQKIAETHWRGYFEAFEQLQLECDAVFVIDWVQLMSSKDWMAQSLTPDIHQLIQDGYFDLAARRLGFYLRSSYLRARKTDWWYIVLDEDSLEYIY